jgi:hypothetical protein
MRFRFAMDRAELLAALEPLVVSYLVCDHLKTPAAVIFPSADCIPNLGKSLTGDPNSDNRYLLVRPGTRYVPRKIERNDGTTVWAWDNLAVDAPIICFGGATGSKYLIGELATIDNTSDESRQIYAEVKKQIFASSFLLSGVRVGKTLAERKPTLTYSIKLNSDFDFRYPD